MLLTGLPGTYFPGVTTFWEWLTPDKIIHIFIFGVQAFLLLFAFGEQYSSVRNRLIYSSLLLIVVLFALLTEVLQAYVFIGRDGNLYDFIADVIGVGVGFVAHILYFKKKKVNF